MHNSSTPRPSVREGARHDVLKGLAVNLRRRGLEHGQLLEALRRANHERCHPPLPDREVANLARWVVDHVQPGKDQPQPGPEVAADPLGWFADYLRIPQDFLEQLPLRAEGNCVAFHFASELPVKLRRAGTKDFTWRPAGAAVPPLWPLPGPELPEVVWLAEGETDALVARFLGLEAFALTRGAGAALDLAQAEALRARGVQRVVLALDADQAGQEGTEKLARVLQAAGLEVLTVDWTAAGLDPLQGCKDLRDLWLASRDPARVREGLEGAVRAVTLPATGGRPVRQIRIRTSGLNLREEALSGLLGEFTRAVAPHTEAHPAAVLATGLAVFGNLLGPGPHVRVGDTRHGLKIWPLTVGPTGRGRKGTALDLVLALVEAAFPDWKAKCLAVGLTSGEGLIYAVRDTVEHEGKVLDPGAPDKRLCVVETEFAGVLRVLAREGNSLSAVLRQAWDRDHLRSLVKNSPQRATGCHVTVVGHVVAEELLRYLHETEVLGGLLNRFLVLAVRRTKLLPDPEPLPSSVMNTFVARLRRLVEEGRRVGEVRRDEEAAALWREVYQGLTADRSGLYGAATARAEAQVARLAALYALSDGSEVVRVPHLKAALALWEYADESCRTLLGDRTGDPVADRILEEIRASGGLSRTEVHHLFQRHVTTSRLQAALRFLEEAGLVLRVEEGYGRNRREKWLPAQGRSEPRIGEVGEEEEQSSTPPLGPPSAPDGPDPKDRSADCEEDLHGLADRLLGPRVDPGEEPANLRPAAVHGGPEEPRPDGPAGGRSELENWDW